MFLINLGMAKLQGCNVNCHCPNSSNPAPGDYRRFVGYCVLHNIEFKILNNSDLKDLLMVILILLL